MARRPALATPPQPRQSWPAAVLAQSIALVPTERVAISVVIPTLNEAARMQASLEGLRWAEQVIVVDGGSGDRTVSIAKRYGADVLVVRGRTIAEQRNAGISRARHHWVLALDADELVTPELRASLDRLTRAVGTS